MAKIKKAQMGKGVPKSKAVTESGKMVDRKAFMKRQDDMVKSMNDQYFSRPENKKAVAPKKKMKNGGKMAKKAMSGMKMMKGGGKCKNGC
jgi:hypothetical protein